MRNIIFDLGGVVFSRDYSLCSSDLLAFWRIIHSPDIPLFWQEFDRGTLSWNDTISAIANAMHLSTEHCDEILREAIAQSKSVPSTCQLICDLKKTGHKLYVLSNMSFAFINELHKDQIFKQFDGEVISCNHKLIKPEPEIYKLTLDKFGLDASETFFIDDKPANTLAAQKLGISTYNFDRSNPEKCCGELRKILIHK